MGKKKSELDLMLDRVAERLERMIESEEYAPCLTLDCMEITRHASGFCRICRVRTCRVCGRGFTLGAATTRMDRQNICANCYKVKGNQGGDSDE